MSVEDGDAGFSGNRPPSRRCRGKTFAAVSVAMLLGGLAWFWMRQVPQEPVYLSKPLRVWLRTYGWSSSSGRGSREWNQADDAVRHMGTNCIPILLNMLGAKDDNIKLRLVALAQKQQLIKIHFVPAAERNAEASKAFLALGDRAKGAVPALVKLFNRDVSADSQVAIEDTFAWIGPPAKPAVPLLLRATTKSNTRVRASALWALGEIHAEPDVCVPELINALSDTDAWVQLSAAHALGQFGKDAEAAVPTLAQLANVSLGSGVWANKVQLRLEARNALKKILPQGVPPSTQTGAEPGAAGTDWWSIPMR